MKKLRYMGILCILICTSCSSMKTFKGTSDLHGGVYDVKNRPVADCIILVDGKEKARTDVNGRFVLYGLKSGTYAVETQSNMCEKFTGDISFLNETQYALITVVDKDTLYELIEKHLQKNEIEEAEKQIFRLLEIDLNNPNAIMYLALIRCKENNGEAALRVLQDAEKRGISDVWMKSFAEKMEEEREKDS